MNNFILDVISSIDKLHESPFSPSQSSHTIGEIITPEWYRSESLQIFENTYDMTWDSLLQSKIVSESIKDLHAYGKSRRDIIFEKSFCSWYQPYHFIPRTKWGIHVRYSSWIKIARQLSEECPPLILKMAESLVSAFLYMYYHGIFHHMTENAASMIELKVGKPNYYLTYYSNIYAQKFNSSDCIEESIANSFLYEHASSCHIEDDYLRKELLLQGNGYQEFTNFTGDNFAKGCKTLITQIRIGQRNPSYADPFDDILENCFLNESTNFKIPIWLHRKPLAVHKIK